MKGSARKNGINYPKAKCETLVETLPRGLKAVIATKGASTKYWSNSLNTFVSDRYWVLVLLVVYSDINLSQFLMCDNRKMNVGIFCLFINIYIMCLCSCLSSGCFEHHHLLLLTSILLPRPAGLHHADWWFHYFCCPRSQLWLLWGKNTQHSDSLCESNWNLKMFYRYWSFQESC